MTLPFGVDPYGGPSNNGDLPSWGDDSSTSSPGWFDPWSDPTPITPVQTLPTISVTVPRPAVIVPRVIDTVSTLPPLQVAPMAASSSGVPSWVLYLGLAALGYWLFTKRGR